MADRPDATSPPIELVLTQPERVALRAALLRARAAELSEVRRRHVRLTAGYGDDTAREVMDDEGDRAQRRFDALGVVLDALEPAPRADD